uniref:ISXO2-like transposase domain-containing protein n=1 Tax=Octopus bimaculoides TaxID=37653 RepID=A0A0L8GRX1_OCTBM
MTSAYISVNGINLRDIAIATATTAESINWLKRHGLLNTPQNMLFWVLGALERDTRRCFLVAVEDRSADTLLEIIQERALPGTTIISHLWRSYNTLNQLGYRHFTVNHSINFVDPITFATTSHIECLWKHVKNCNKRVNGTARSLLQSHLIEFMWRYEFKDEIFGKLLEQIRHLHPCV